ncbi:MAG TPA: AAA family ATPase [Myxococcota bacterium]|jgi:cell division protease FtsH|nr:AAA family ATPase [Myxococcota bacterium]
MSVDLPIDGLPENLSEQEAVEAVYGEDLDWIVRRLRQRLSVLVECDKALVPCVFVALRARARAGGAGAAGEVGAEPLRLQLVDGHGVEVPGGAIARTIAQLSKVVGEAGAGDVLVLPHLDLMTNVAQGGLTADAKEVLAALGENPELTVVGFQDPGLEIPRTVRDMFEARRALVGIPRHRLAAVVLRREARKLGERTFNPFALYKYVSGTNAVKLRRILGHLHGEIDFDPAHPETAQRLYRAIRDMTLSALEVPRVDLARDVGGYEKVKERLRDEVLALLAHKDRLGADAEAVARIESLVPRGIILSGPPGTGKTFFAKAIATAIDATVQVVSGPELKSKWVGESEANLRRVFHQARASAPAIIVFDELDSFAVRRGTYLGSGVEHSMVNQLLTEMDGFRKEELVLVVGTTNFVEALDPALLRPGRFELLIDVPWPGEDDRRAIIDVYRGKLGLAMDDAVRDEMVRLTAGWADEAGTSRFSGDHLHAACKAIKRDLVRRSEEGRAVTRADVERALGDRFKQAPITEAERRTIACHEAGHALAAMLLPRATGVQKVSIAGGDSFTLGYVLKEVRHNRYVRVEAELLDDICVAFGGRVAEAMVLGEVSIGAYADLQQATELARAMVEELGMGSTTGPRALVRGGVEGGGEAGRAAVSPDTARRVDEEIDRLLRGQYARCEELLRRHRDAHRRLWEALLERSELTREEVKELLRPALAVVAAAAGARAGAVAESAVGDGGEDEDEGDGEGVGRER